MKRLFTTLPMFRKLNIVKQMLALYFILIFVPSVVTMVIFYQQSSGLIEQEYSVSTLKTLNQTANNVAYYFRNVTNTSNVFISNPRLYQYLDKEQSSQPFDLYKQIEQMRGDIASIENNTDVFKVRVFVDPNMQYSREKIRFFSIEAIRNEAWYPNVLDKDGKIVWIGTHEQAYLDETQTYQIISAARIIRHPSNYDRVIGIVMVDMKEELIADSLTKANLAEARNLYVVDAEGRAISHSNPSLIGSLVLVNESLTKAKTSTEGFFKRNFSGEMQYVLYQQIPYTDWRIVAEIPISLISSKNKTFTKMSGVFITMITFIVFILSIVLLFAFIMRGMNSRMKEISNIMVKEGIVDYTGKIEEDFGVLQKLERNVIQIVQNVKRLTEETYQGKLNERELELRALQAQINPHFLYNTLERINWMAISRNADDISGVISSLSTYFRLTLNKGRDIVEVRDEIRLAEVYLDIQRNRFGDHFEVQFDIDEAVMPLMMPKLTLQPIIENALLHGIRKKLNHKGTIRIQSRLQGDELMVNIEDDGTGMTEEQVNRLLSPPSDKEGASGYGLYNVHERIKLFAGDTYGVQVESTEGQGTKVRIRLKAV
jgi:two-component system sensor histidine kinase YesM